MHPFSSIFKISASAICHLIYSSPVHSNITVGPLLIHWFTDPRFLASIYILLGLHANTERKFLEHAMGWNSFFNFLQITLSMSVFSQHFPFNDKITIDQWRTCPSCNKLTWNDEGSFKVSHPEYFFPTVRRFMIAFQTLCEDPGPLWKATSFFLFWVRRGLNAHRRRYHQFYNLRYVHVPRILLSKNTSTLTSSHLPLLLFKSTHGHQYFQYDWSISLLNHFHNTSDK
jgi:hypothetical protein